MEDEIAEDKILQILCGVEEEIEDSEVLNILNSVEDKKIDRNQFLSRIQST
jgi:hypothetical protein